jgi:hypothetical protein
MVFNMGYTRCCPSYHLIGLVYMASQSNCTILHPHIDTVAVQRGSAGIQPDQ